MATKLKTISYSYDTILAPALNSLGSFGSINISIPEASATGGVTFKSVIGNFYFCEKSTPSAATNLNITTRRVDVNLNSAGVQTFSNAATITNSAEDINACYIFDLTNYFNTNWGAMDGTPKSLSAAGLVNGSTGYTPGNYTLTIDATYEYNDEATTHVKTVYIPVTPPVGALATTITTVDTVSALSSYLPENSISIKNCALIIQGNLQVTSTTDMGFTSVISGSLTSDINSYDSFEATGNTDIFYRVSHSFDATALGWDSSPINIRLTSSPAGMHHPQMYIQVTYEFNATATTSLLCSLMMPTEIASPMGGLTSSDYQRCFRTLLIQEQNPILKSLAYYFFYDSNASITGLNCRIWDQISFSAFTDGAADVAGSMALCVNYKGNTAITRGRNTFTFDVYRTAAALPGFNLGGFFLINYTCDKPTEGVGSENHTVKFNKLQMSATTAAVEFNSNFNGITLPESKYFINGIGCNIVYLSNGTGNPAGITMLIEQNNEAFDGNVWYPVYTDISTTDPETGIRNGWAQLREIFKRYPGDVDSARLDLSSSRTMRITAANACTIFPSVDFYLTYHGISYSLTSTVSNSAGGTVTLDLHRKLNGVDEKVLQKTRTGNGAVVWDWYDDTETMFISSRETDALVGRSGDFTF